MPELVTVSSVEKMDSLRTTINELFEHGKFAEIVQTIGMHSIMMEPEHMISDQDSLYHLVLNLVKKKIQREDPKRYSAWLIAFPALLSRLVNEGQVIADDAAQSALVSRLTSFGPFTSLDEFYFWALEDRRLPLDQLIRYIYRTTEMHR